MGSWLMRTMAPGAPVSKWDDTLEPLSKAVTLLQFSWGCMELRNIACDQWHCATADHRCSSWGARTAATSCSRRATWSCSPTLRESTDLRARWPSGWSSWGRSHTATATPPARTPSPHSTSTTSALCPPTSRLNYLQSSCEWCCWSCKTPFQGYWSHAGGW